MQTSRHWIKGFGKIPVAIATTEEMIIKLKSNEDGIKETIINGNIRLVLSIASRFASRVPHKADDIGAVALTELVRIVHGIADGHLMTEHNNFTAYLSRSIIFKIREYTNTDYTIVPNYTNKDIQQLIKNDPDTYTLMYTPCEFHDQAQAKTVHDSLALFLRDLYSTGKFTEEDKKIIGLRLAGYNDVEIGQLLQYTPQYIGKKRVIITQKVKKLL